MSRLIIASAIFFFTFNAFAVDCGIKPKGMEFGANCELIRVTSPKGKKSNGSPLSVPASEPVGTAVAPSAAKKMRAWQPIMLGAYAGKPGFYAMIGTALDLKVDAILMNEDVLEKAQLAVKDLSLGGVIGCEAVATQQSIGFTVFDLRNCTGKK